MAGLSTAGGCPRARRGRRLVAQEEAAAVAGDAIRLLIRAHRAVPALSRHGRRADAAPRSSMMEAI
jgi:hypothetical protein